MRLLRALLAVPAFVFAAAVLVAEEPAYHYRIEAAGSELAWELPATLHTVHGEAPDLSGTIDAVSGANRNWSVRTRVVVKAAAMVTGNASRDRNMREKVLETAVFPEIVFEARRVDADLSLFRDGAHFTVAAAGELTVHGKLASIEVPVNVQVFADHVLLEGSFPLSWKQYGLKDPSFGIVTVRDPLKVSFRLRAVPAAGGQ